MGRPSKAEIAAREAAQAQEQENEQTVSAAATENETQASTTDAADTESAPMDTAETVTEETKADDVQPDVPVDEPKDVIAALQEQIKALQEKIQSAGSTPSVVLAKPEEMVKVTYISNVSATNILDLGDFGQMTGVGWVIEVPRKDFGGKFMTPFVQKLIAKRRLIVLDGLNDDERIRYNVDYKPGEVMDVQMFDKLIGMDVEKLTNIFDNLCAQHQQFVATRFITAYERGDNRITRGVIEPLQALSKKNHPNGLFNPILEKMNKDSM